MSVSVNIDSALRHFTNGLDVIEVSGSTVGQCLDQLVKRFPDIASEGFYKNGKLSEFVDFYVNRQRVDPHKLTMPTKDGDVIHIMLIIGGG